ncbi:hypothetical protein OEA41_007988 [Lepraria neglecta]|uniref:Uncharacterized protein n=1 Tax=Lepraria neglecta TaxID=209136 RepID=A0AAD9ZGP3_9LECA|nr:hypothetical protein OEA41_007988 [Lepraria neglecta]
MAMPTKKTTPTTKAVTGATALPTTVATQNTDLADYTEWTISLTTPPTIYDIFYCNNFFLFNQMAPAGTPERNNKAKNDENGWPTYKGGGCRCIKGNLCCTPDAEVAVLNSDGTIGTKGAAAWFTDVPNTNGKSCTCNQIKLG